MKKSSRRGVYSSPWGKQISASQKFSHHGAQHKKHKQGCNWVCGSLNDVGQASIFENIYIECGPVTPQV